VIGARPLRSYFLEIEESPGKPIGHTLLKQVLALELRRHVAV
jgi:hypothetical protein